jgi:lipid-A-disaccharide synthase-like uncharacterized protein
MGILIGLLVALVALVGAVILTVRWMTQWPRSERDC